MFTMSIRPSPHTYSLSMVTIEAGETILQIVLISLHLVNTFFFFAL